jgi:hypothetical protein
MGFVYKARDTLFNNRLVAVKEMRQTGLTPQEVVEAAEQFKQEAMLLASLKHPSLPSIYDHFAATGRWYLVMDFIEGETLADHLNKAPGKALPTSEVLDLGIQLSKVQGYLHTRPTPIIFRDLKPSNIMLTPEGNVYLIDFGIARFFKSGQTTDTYKYGSVGYAAPEQFGKAQTSPQSDIYSLGVILHQMLSGNDPSLSPLPPFQFAPLPSHGQPALTKLAALIKHMLDEDASKRPASMSEVKQTLEWIKNQQPPRFPPPHDPTKPVLPPPNKWKWRTLATVTALLFSIVAGMLLCNVHSSPTPGPDANATASAVAAHDATASVVAANNATATAAVWATAVVKNPDLYPPAGTLALVDPLSQPYEWTAHSDANWGGQCQFVNGMYYQIHQLPSNKFYPCVNDGPNGHDIYSNFAFEVNMTITQGDCGGLTIRDNGDTSNAYVFQVCQNGSYSFDKYVSNSNSTNLKQKNNSPAINQGTGQSNVIAVVANGSTLDLYVNGQKIDSTSDPSYSRGNIGLIAEAISNETTVTYQEAKVWTLS